MPSLQQATLPGVSLDSGGGGRNTQRAARPPAAFEKADPSAVVVLGDEVVEDRPLWRQFQRIGGNLTPQDVSTIILEADCGNIERLVNLANEARQKDGHLHSVLQTRELALKGLDWDLVPPRDPSGPEKKATEDLKAILEEADNFPDLVHHLTGSGVYHGHATAETMYRFERVRSRQLIVPYKWNRIHSNRFAFGQTTGELLFTEDGRTGENLLENYPGKFVQYQPLVNGDAPAREGLSRLLVWLALFRNWDLRDWLQYGEIGWKPWRLGTFEKGAHKKDIEILKRALRTLTTTGAAVLSDATKLSVEWPKGVGSTITSSHKELFDTIGAEMSKAVIGQTLSTEQGNRGSQSLGKVQEKVRGDILVADAIGEAAVISRHVIRPFYQLNHPPSVRPARFIFRTEDSVDLETFSKAIEKLVKAGLEIPSEWVRNQGGIPEPQKGQDTIGGRSQETNANDPEQPGDDPEDDEDEDEDA